MSASDEEDRPPDSPPRELGRIGEGATEGGLSTPERRGAPGEPTGPPGDAPLRLPRGGLVALRMSGGLRFSSREIVVYRNGRTLYRQTAPDAEERSGKLQLAQLVELHYLLRQARFAEAEDAGRQSPDAFAYEIVARVGRTLRSADVYEGGVPESLKSLIRRLRALMPMESDAPGDDQ